jgi:hypothetical protein
MGVVGAVILFVLTMAVSLAIDLALTYIGSYGVCWVMMGFGHPIRFWPTFWGLWMFGVIVDLIKMK